MKISLKIFLCFIICLFFAGSSQALQSVTGKSVIKVVTSDSKSFVLRDAKCNERAHGEKIETTVISGPLSGDHSTRTLNCRFLQELIYKQKEDSYNSYNLIFKAKNFNRSSLSAILRL